MNGEPSGPIATSEFDLRLRLPNHALFVGPSMSGKTRLALKLLEQAPQSLHPTPTSVHIFYDQWQEQYRQTQERLERLGIRVTISPGGASLTLADFEAPTTTTTTTGPAQQTLILIDDAGDETAASPEIARIFTNGRHKSLSLWLLWHTLYSKHPPSRTIAQNAAYQFFLPAPRLGSQLRSLDAQLAYGGALTGAYRQTLEETDWARRHLLLDLTPTTPEPFRLRTQVTNPNNQRIFLRRF